MFEKIYRPALLVLLALILVANSMSFVLEYQQKKQCDQAAETYRDILLTTLDEYDKAVYDNPNVDNINKQIFRANEYQVILAHSIATLIMECH